MRRATGRNWRKQSNRHKFLSTLSLRRATRVLDGSKSAIEISIHALLAESDIKIRYIFRLSKKFLSTLSLRRATVNGGAPSSSFGNFYPRSPCGERRPQKTGPVLQRYFYPRSPCGERRALMGGLSCNGNFYPRSPCGERPILDYFSGVMRQFLSTLSLRRATVHYDNYNLHCVISIHALLAESDQQGKHHPHHERGFLSTLSLRRATTYLSILF